MDLSQFDLSEIRQALATESAAATKPFSFKIKAARSEGGRLVLTVGRTENQAGAVIVDEALEGSQAWWPEPDKGGGEVFMVAAEEDELWLDNRWGSVPQAGGIVLFYPPRFLDSLQSMWNDTTWVGKVRTWLARCPVAMPAPMQEPTIPAAFSILRSAQRLAVKLQAEPVGYLWGPPGTGKTTTVGAKVACYLTQYPKARVMILATTNTAVDEALLSVDDSFKRLGHSDADAKSVRTRVRRIGHNLDIKRYATRQHLLPPKNPEAIKALIDHQRKRPNEGSDSAVVAQWRATDDSLRQRIREIDIEMLRSSQVAAMTCTRAAYGFDLLRQLPAFDLLVIDEASQVSLAYALALLPYGKNVLFVGDPEQLAPIAKSESVASQRWLAESPFSWRQKLAPDSATVFLDEQSRMAPAICSVVGDTFYDRKLRVCARAAADSAWLQSRRKIQASGTGFDIVPVTMAGRFSAAWGGPVREESAEQIVTLIRDLLRRVEPEEIQILTPFRAQRKMIRAKLKQAEIHGMRVTTVHRAQGSERMVVLFDPVEGDSGFFAGASGRRLINVALSRAQAQVYLFLSSRDLHNPVLDRIAHGAGYQVDALKLPLLCELANHPQFPRVLDGMVFGYRGAAVRITGPRGGGGSVNLAHVRGKAMSGRFNLSGMRTSCCDLNNCPLHNGAGAPRCVT
jgi:DNA replication ATP-dependent helicase Dna2